MHYGEWVDQITFIDGNRENTKIDNLKCTTRSYILHKAIKRKDNTSGYKGVSWSSERNKWVAMISKNRKIKFIGYFYDKETAYKAYLEASNVLYGD